MDNLHCVRSPQNNVLCYQVASLQKGKQFSQKVQENLHLQYWCGILASYGCNDPRIALWLQTEYFQFQSGNFPDQVSIKFIAGLCFMLVGCFLSFTTSYFFSLRFVTQQEFCILIIVPLRAMNAFSLAKERR